MSEHQQTQSKKPESSPQKRSTPTIQTPVSHPASIIQRARINPKSLTAADVLQLQRTIGNRAVGKLLSEIRNTSKVQQAPIQRQKLEEETCPSCMQKQEIPEEEEPLQSKMADSIQRQEMPEEEEPLQGKFETIQRLEPEEEEKLQMKSVVQRQEIPEEKEPLQGKMIETVQRQEIPEEEEPLQTKRENNTGMPDNLKAGVESLSGIDMSDVRVHYNSSKPAEVGALAYTQRMNIHVAPGQERHLPHEAWHVVQQVRGRVKPTIQLKGGIQVNDDEGLEHEADVMGAKVASPQKNENLIPIKVENPFLVKTLQSSSIIQGYKLKTKFIYTVPAKDNQEEFVVTIEGRNLIDMLSQFSQYHKEKITGNRFLQDFYEAVEKYKTEQPKRQTFSVGQQTLDVGDNEYVSVSGEDAQIGCFGKSFGRGGPSYPELAEVFLKEIGGSEKTKKAAETGQPEKSSKKERELAQNMRNILLKGEDSKITLSPVAANLLGVLGGAETFRNPKSFDMLLMFLDLVIGNRMNFKEGLGPTTSDTVEKRGPNKGNILQGVGPTFTFLELPPPKHKLDQRNILTDYLKGLDLDEKHKGQIQRYMINVSSWGGALPMTGGDTESLGKEGIQKVDKKTSGSKKDAGLNLVQAKEATMIINWLDFKIGAMSTDEKNQLNESFRTNREDPIKAIEGIIERLVKESEPQLPSSKNEAKQVESKMDPKTIPTQESETPGEDCKEDTAVSKFRLLEEKLKSRGLKLKKITGDGNCFYEAVIDQINSQGAPPIDVKTLRGMIANLIDNNRKEFEGFAQDNNSLDDIIAQIRKSGSWSNEGGDIAPQLISTVLQCPYITIIQPSEDVPDTTPRKDLKTMNATHPVGNLLITLVYDGSMHYDSTQNLE